MGTYISKEVLDLYQDKDKDTPPDTKKTQTTIKVK